jgi:predicted RNase H-like HicB family nuclease
MTEIVFLIEESLDGGYTAQAAGIPIFTQAETIEDLRQMIRDAVQCHFDDPAQIPKIIRLHFTRDEVIAT